MARPTTSWVSQFTKRLHEAQTYRLDCQSLGVGSTGLPRSSQAKKPSPSGVLPQTQVHESKRSTRMTSLVFMVIKG